MTLAERMAKDELVEYLRTWVHDQPNEDPSALFDEISRKVDSRKWIAVRVEGSSIWSIIVAPDGRCKVEVNIRFEKEDMHRYLSGTEIEGLNGQMIRALFARLWRELAGKETPSVQLHVII